MEYAGGDWGESRTLHPGSKCLFPGLRPSWISISLEVLPQPLFLRHFRPAKKSPPTLLPGCYPQSRPCLLQGHRQPL